MLLLVGLGIGDDSPRPTIIRDGTVAADHDVRSLAVMNGRRRTLDVDGLLNARDLGGLPLVDGGLTPSGVFFRSETVDVVTSTGWHQLRAAGVRTVVDLRQSGERARDVTARPDWLVTVPVDLDGLENREFWAACPDNGGSALYFLPHLAAMPERTGAVLTALAEAPEGGVLFHCMGGRDRTGLISMVLLSLAGVEPEAIVDDYLETVRLGAVRAAAAGRDDDEAQIEVFLSALGTTTEQAFRDALAGLDVDRVLDAAGVTESTREILRTWRGAL